MKVPDTRENLKKCICGQCPSYSQCMNDKGESLYCSLGESSCDVERMACICAQCPIFTQYDLDKFYYCLPVEE